MLLLKSHIFCQETPRKTTKEEAMTSQDITDQLYREFSSLLCFLIVCSFGKNKSIQCLNFDNIINLQPQDKGQQKTGEDKEFTSEHAHPKAHLTRVCKAIPKFDMFQSQLGMI